MKKYITPDFFIFFNDQALPPYPLDLNAAVTGHSKKFCRVFPISSRLFCYLTCIFKRPSLLLFRFKISHLSPYGGFLGDFMQNGINCEILNLNNRRLGRLKIHKCYIKKSLVLMGETLQKI